LNKELESRNDRILELEDQLLKKRKELEDLINDKNKDASESDLDKNKLIKEKMELEEEFGKLKSFFFFYFFM
jgi:hypothetical protein